MVSLLRSFLAMLLVIPCANAEQGYPSKPLTMVVAFAPGGGTDTAARLVAKELSVELGQPIVVDNRAGAGGAIGAASVVRAAPDGYTLLFGTGSELAILPVVKAKPPYDPLNDFVPVSQVGAVSFVLVAHPSVQAKTVAELIALARTSPEQITYASFGIGSTNHLIGELFSSKTGLRLLHVPYKGSAAAATDLLSGQVRIAFDTASVMMPYVQSGRLKALATLSPSRSRLAPELPTMAESGVAGLATEGWLGVLAPRNTPPAIVERLNRAITKVLRLPAVMEALKARGVQVVANRPEEFRTFIGNDVEKWKGVVRTSGIQIE